MDKIVSELKKAMAIYEQRNKKYKDSYKMKGGVMEIIFPGGIELKTKDDFNRFSAFSAVVSKMIRYARQFENGGHMDSAHDAIVYAAMLCEATEEKDETQ